MNAPAPRPQLRVGDPFPRVVLPDPTGTPVDLSHQLIAGDPLVLFVVPDGAPETAALAAALPAFAEAGAHVYTVSRAAPADEELGALVDPEAKLAGLARVKAPSLLVISPRGRLHAVLEAGAVDAALALVKDLAPAREPVLLEGTAPVLIVPDIVEAALRADLIGYWERGKKEEDKLATGTGGADTGDPRLQAKKRADVMIEDKDLFMRLRDRLERRLLPEMARAFHFQPARFEALRVGCYPAHAGWFKRHRDNATPYTAHRRYAMSLNLNTGDYTGGQVRFPEFGPDLYEAPAGGAVVFSCSLLHEAMPVTAGNRFAVFTFFTDAAGAERERQLMAEMEAKGKGGGVTVR